MSQTEQDYSPPKSHKSKSLNPKTNEKTTKKSVEKVKEVKVKQKVAKKKKESKGKKQSKTKKESKGKKQDGIDVKPQVKDYMQKQNRPYNLLNVFDNLHGKIKKPILQTTLNDLVQQKFLSCKEFGKNKVYFLNQDRLSISKQNIDHLSQQYTELRAEEMQLNDQYKRLMDQYKKLISKKTKQQIKNNIQQLHINNQKLKTKKESLMSQGSTKVDQEIVKKIEANETMLRKQLSKRRKLTKECLSVWSEMTEKKVSEVAQMMGVEL